MIVYYILRIYIIILFSIFNIFIYFYIYYYLKTPNRTSVLGASRYISIYNILYTDHYNKFLEFLFLKIYY